MKEKKPLKQHILDFFGDSSPFMTLVGKGALLVVLNVCWLALCLPVVTAGASTAALYAVLQSEEYSYLSAPFAFFRAFRIRAREATVLWLQNQGNDAQAAFREKMAQVDNAVKMLMEDGAEDLLASAGCENTGYPWSEYPLAMIQAIMEAVGVRE